MADLKSALHEFDGKAVSLLSEAAVRFGAAPGYLQDLVEFSAAPDGHVSAGATWLLKHHLDTGGDIETVLTDRLALVLPEIVNWQAQLHICQFLGRLSVSDVAAERYSHWLQPLLSHRRPFLRAWSTDALCALARDRPAYLERATSALSAAREDQAASVRARARQISLS